MHRYIFYSGGANFTSKIARVSSVFAAVHRAISAAGQDGFGCNWVWLWLLYRYKIDNDLAPNFTIKFVLVSSKNATVCRP